MERGPRQVGALSVMRLLKGFPPGGAEQDPLLRFNNVTRRGPSLAEGPTLDEGAQRGPLVMN